MLLSTALPYRFPRASRGRRRGAGLARTEMRARFPTVSPKQSTALGCRAGSADRFVRE